MAERALTLHSWEVLGILGGYKTQIRRPVKLRGNRGVEKDHKNWRNCCLVEPLDGEWSWQHLVDIRRVITERSPFGKRGDHVWVREPYCHQCDKKTEVILHDKFYYEADDSNVRAVDGDGFTRYRKDGTEASPWISPQRMPRSASRITLYVRWVRVERISELTLLGACSEGLKQFTKDNTVFKYWPCDPCDGPLRCDWQDLPRDPVSAVKTVWDRVHAKGPYITSNDPWVWVAEVIRL